MDICLGIGMKKANYVNATIDGETFLSLRALK